MLRAAEQGRLVWADFWRRSCSQAPKVAKAKEVVGLLVAVWLRLVCAIAHAGDGAAGGLGSAMCCKVAAMWPGAPARGGGSSLGFGSTSQGLVSSLWLCQVWRMLAQGLEAHELHLLRADQTGGSVCSVARRRGCSGSWRRRRAWLKLCVWARCQLGSWCPAMFQGLGGRFWFEVGFSIGGRLGFRVLICQSACAPAPVLKT